VNVFSNGVPARPMALLIPNALWTCWNRLGCMEAVEGDGACRWLFPTTEQDREYKGKCIMKMANADTLSCLIHAISWFRSTLKTLVLLKVDVVALRLTFLPLLFVHFFLGLEIGLTRKTDFFTTEHQILNSILLRETIMRQPFRASDRVGRPSSIWVTSAWSGSSVHPISSQSTSRNVDPFHTTWYHSYVSWLGIGPGRFSIFDLEASGRSGSCMHPISSHKYKSREMNSFHTTWYHSYVSWLGVNRVDWHVDLERASGGQVACMSPNIFPASTRSNVVELTHDLLSFHKLTWLGIGPGRWHIRSGEGVATVGFCMHNIFIRKSNVVNPFHDTIIHMYRDWASDRVDLAYSIWRGRRGGGSCVPN
jgi:hypothetical protein